MTRSNLDDHSGSGMITDTRYIAVGSKYFDVSFIRAQKLERVNICAYEKDVANTFLNLTFLGPCIVNVFLSMTNKMQHCIILFIIVNALHVSRGFPLIIRSSNLYMQHQVFVELVCCCR